MIGIYRITNPNGKIYIGQSINLEKRFSNYRCFDCKKQHKLYNSFVKYGVGAHSFEIIEECEKELLNDRERYYQDLYNVCSERGLNIRLTDSTNVRGELSLESRNKIRDSKLGKSRTEECKLKISNSLKGRKHSEEYKRNMSIVKRGSLLSDETKQNISKAKSYKVVDTSTNITYDSPTQVSIIFNINKSTLISRLNGRLKNNTVFIYLKNKI